MQGRGTIIILSIVLAAICFYELTFTHFTGKVEDAARVYAESQIGTKFEDANTEQRKAIERAETFYLDSVGDLEAHPMGGTYDQISQKQINLGLDLQGGLSVTLEVPVQRILTSLINNKRDADFKTVLTRATELQQESNSDYLTLFADAWNEIAPSRSMAEIFTNKNNMEKINATSTNDVVIDYLKGEIETVISNTEHILRTRIDGLGLKSPNISRAAGSERIVVELAGAKNPDEIKRWLQSSAKLEFWDTYHMGEILGGLQAANAKFVDKEKAEEKLNESSEEESTSNKEIEQEKDEEDLFAALDTAKSGELEAEGKNYGFFRYMQFASQSGLGATVAYIKTSDTAKVNKYLNSAEVKTSLPKDCELMWSSPSSGFEEKVAALYAIKWNSRGPKLDGNSIIDARQGSDQYGKPEVNMTMNDYGRRKWRQMTKAAHNNGQASRCIAIILDGKVVSAPMVNGEIAGGVSSITGSYTVKEAKDFANILQSGKLPAKPEIIEESIVGPTLGATSVKTSLNALIAGLLIVLVFMVFYYNRSGFVADAALFLNLFFIVGILAGYGATLTLPGMAGLVLTIGMSVDANVIIFERIREELRRGLDFKTAITSGFKHSYSAIIDANITTLLTGVILAYFGSGPVKGFATVLIIGILTSFFTAVLVTRAMLQGSINKNKEIKFETGLSKGLLVNANFNFFKVRKKMYAASLIIIMLGVASMFTRGFEKGVEFEGGREYKVELSKAAPTDKVKEALAAVFTDASTVVKTYGDESMLQITTSFMKDENGTVADSTVKSSLIAGLNTIDSEHNIVFEKKVGPTIADDFRRTSLISTIVGILAIFFYIFVRFSKVQFGAGAVLAIFHDVLIVLSMFSIFRGILPFDLEISQAFIAALLTIIGYSINDTVVIFDRIREYFAKGTKENPKTVINRAVNSTLSRTLMTSVTTMIVVSILLIFGSDVIKGFAFALFVGVISGTYSSIFIATPMLVDLDNSEGQNFKDMEVKEEEVQEIVQA